MSSSIVKQTTDWACNSITWQISSLPPKKFSGSRGLVAMWGDLFIFRRKIQSSCSLSASRTLAKRFLKSFDSGVEWTSWERWAHEAFTKSNLNTKGQTKHDVSANGGVQMEPFYVIFSRCGHMYVNVHTHKQWESVHFRPQDVFNFCSYFFFFMYTAFSLHMSV